MATARWISTSSTNWDTGSNWSTAAEPAASDTVILEYNSVGIAGSDQSANTLAAIHFRQTYTGLVGDRSTHGEPGTPLKISATNVYIGENHEGMGAAPGSARLNLDLHTTATTVRVIQTSHRTEDPYIPPVRLLGTNVANVLYHERGRVGLAMFAGQTSQFSAITLGQRGANLNSAELICGSGLTLATFTGLSGTARLFCGGTNMTIWSGCEVHLEGLATTAGWTGTITVKAGGRLILKGGGTNYGTIVLESGSYYDETQTDVPRTVAQLTIEDGARALLNSAVTKTALTPPSKGGFNFAASS